MDDKEINLTGKEKFDLTVEAGLQTLPYIGGPLATLYFGTKQEKRFKRIEKFYHEFSEELEQLGIKLLSIENHNEDNLISIIEELNEKIERESSEEKIKMFKKYLLSTLTSPTDNNFDTRRYFLDVLSSMTILECEILMLLKSNGRALARNISKPNVDQYAIIGSIGRLKSFGFLVALTQTVAIGGDNAFNELVSISSFGEEFINYCLE